MLHKGGKVTSYGRYDPLERLMAQISNGWVILPRMEFWIHGVIDAAPKTKRNDKNPNPDQTSNA